MTERQAETGQLKKLIFTKKYSDQYGVKWRLSSWKVLFWMVLTTILLITIFSFFTEDQGNFVRDVLFYSIIIMIIIMIAWIAGNFIWKARKVFYQFLIGWILILGTYLVLGIIFQAVGFYPNGFHYGTSTWIIISTLALGARSIDQNLDRKDLFYAMLIIIIILIANYPIFSEDIGFLAKLDSLLDVIFSYLPWSL